MPETVQTPSPSTDSSPASNTVPAPTPSPVTPAPNIPAAGTPKPEKPAEGQQPNGQPEQKAPEKPADREPESRRFAALAKQQTKIREAENRLKAEREALAKERAEVEQYRKAREAAKLNPLEFLQQAGLTYQELTDTILNNGRPTADLHVKAVDDKLQAFIREQEEARQAQIEAQKKAAAEEEATLRAEWHAEIDKEVRSDASMYEFLNLYPDWISQIPLLIEDRYRSEGKILSTKEAADIVEAHLDELVERGKRAKKSLAKASPQPQGDTKRIESAQQRNTLTNDMTASTNSLGPAKTDAERTARAVAAYLANANRQ